jgi:hypothetical protein
MTLFRKVFQTQARPANSEEALDEDALRAAFKDMETSDKTLLLDPFEHAASDKPEEALEDTQWGGADVEDTFLFDAEQSAKDVEESVGDDPEEEESATASLAQVQSDEEIAACLDRAMAAQPEPVEVAGHEEDDEAKFEADLEAHLDAIEEDDTVCAGAPDLRVEEEGAPENGTAATQEEVSEVAPEEDAAVSFAKQQMAALSGTAPASKEPEPAEGATPVEDLDLGAVPAPAAGRAGRRAGRVKTRLLGFNRSDAASDPFGATPEATATPQREKFPVGWLVIVEGPGVGHSFSIFTGASMIGRGEDQVIRLDFGDNSISRQNHAAIAYDEEQNKFYIGHGGKSNIIRRNARPVLSTEELNHADLLRIGETTLRFVALCGSDFQWHTAEIENASGI